MPGHARFRLPLQTARALLVLAAAVGAATWPPSAGAEPVLELAEHVLPTRPHHVAVVAWEGRPAVLILSTPMDDEDSEAPPVRRISLLRTRDGQPVEVAAWEVSESLRWAEPLTLPGGGSGWLALIGGDWYVGRPAAAQIAWERLCACASAFALGYSALERESPLAEDLDGDGWPEVLLPQWNGLVVYALALDPPGLRPLWRDAWEPDERFREEQGRLVTRLKFPRYLLQDVNRDGVRDLLTMDNQELSVTLHPPRVGSEGPEPGDFHALDAEARTRLRQRELPGPVLAALIRLKDRGFPSRDTAAAAVLEAHEAAAPHLETILEILRQPYPVYFPEPAPRAQPPLPTEESEDEESQDVLAVRDMDGDGVTDLLEITSIEKGDPFNQQNRIAWFRGGLQGGRLRLGAATRTYFTEGLAFAQLVEPLRDGPPTLFLATMEVGVMDLVRAIVARTVTFDTYLYPWRDGALPEQPPVAGGFTFSVDFSEKGSRPYLLLADLDGDGRREFLLNLEPDELVAFPSDPGDAPLGDAPLARLTAPLPDRSDEVMVADLEGDGRETVVLRYKGSDYPYSERRTLRFVRLVDRQAAPDARAPGGQGR